MIRDTDTEENQFLAVCTFPLRRSEGGSSTIIISVISQVPALPTCHSCCTVAVIASCHNLRTVTSDGKWRTH